jgi:hypothetical protein
MGKQYSPIVAPCLPIHCGQVLLQALKLRCSDRTGRDCYRRVQCEKGLCRSNEYGREQILDRKVRQEAGQGLRTRRSAVIGMRRHSSLSVGVTDRTKLIVRVSTHLAVARDLLAFRVRRRQSPERGSTVPVDRLPRESKSRTVSAFDWPVMTHPGDLVIRPNADRGSGGGSWTLIFDFSCACARVSLSAAQIGTRNKISFESL